MLRQQRVQKKVNKKPVVKQPKRQLSKKTTTSNAFKATKHQRHKMPHHFDENFNKHADTFQPEPFDNSSDNDQYYKLKKLREEQGVKEPEPTFSDYTQARQTYNALQRNLVDVTPDDKFPWLDPFNPPNLTYLHVKMLKNIDYSPLIRRAAEGGMFSVEDVITILQKEGTTEQFKSAMRREHLQDPFIFEQTYDVFNRGKKPCPLCLPDPTEDQINRIHYTNVNLLRKYVSTSGMILPRKVSGVCHNHQKKLRYAIKNAKQLALMSYTSNWHVPLSYVYADKYPAYEDQEAAADVERARRMEIKELYDNLVADKLAMQNSNSFNAQDSEDDAETAEAKEIKRLQAAEAEEAKEQQVQTRITQLEAHYETLKAKAEGPEAVAELEAQFEKEKANIESDAAAQKEAEEQLQQQKSDFGDLNRLDKFELSQSFEDFLSRYNTHMASKGLKPLKQNQLFIEDSDNDETHQDRVRRLQNMNLELEKLQEKEGQEEKM